ncbi:unnamed protein product [Rotaria socialis]|uniref:Uncharacterized protein n=1 Tax=Rotaria socialis TaxID=392032 RepID=A0A818UET9_9BILA|nr:unnamed protein product [Rotaria socialis]CAF4826199.1 unnamed protein product [Rotaria socialis]
MASPYFTGRRYIKGYGFGSTLLNWLRTNIVPLVKSGGKYLGSKLIEGGSKAALDILQDDVKPGQAFKQRMNEVGKDIFQTAKRKLLTGKGQKHSGIKKKPKPAKKPIKKKKTDKPVKKKKKMNNSTVF